MEVRDNGKGFDPSHLEAGSEGERDEHLGIRGIRERVELLGGRMVIDTSPDLGTAILVSFPLSEAG